MTFQSVWVVVPTYNERDNLAPLLQSIHAVGDAVQQVLIVDDASPDGTAAAARQFPNVTVLERSGPRGYGHSMRDGLKLALQSGADAVVTMDADLSHDASIIPRMLSILGPFDVVIGSRYCQSQSNVENWSRRRLFISRIATSLVRACTGAAVTDPTAGFRCWNATLLRRMDLDSVQTGGFAFLYELLFYARRAGATFHEVPNLYRGRIHGESKLNTRIVLEALRLLPGLFLRRVTGRP
jgi:dolichol-phosphate mannosyltransferase